MIHRSPLRPWFFVPVLAALAFSAGDAAAQLEFAGIPWGTPADEATARIQAAGYFFRGADQDGDLVFGAADSVDLVATFDSVGLVNVRAMWLRDPDRLPARYDRMADSMRAALGTPETETPGEYERSMLWRGPEVMASIFFRPRGGGVDTALIMEHSGPGFEAEIDRRDELWRQRAEQEGEDGPSDTTAVGDYHQAFGGFRVLIRVDTVQYTRLGPQSYRARFLHNWMQTRRLPNGLMYDALLTVVELDCRAFRTQVARSIPLYDRRATPATFIPSRERRWTQPTADSPDGVALRSACEALGRQP